MMPTTEDGSMQAVRFLAADAARFAADFRDYDPQRGFDPAGMQEEMRSEYFDRYTEAFENAANAYAGHALTDEEATIFDKMLRSNPELVEIMRRVFNYDEGICILLNHYKPNR